MDKAKLNFIHVEDSRKNSWTNQIYFH